MGNFATSCIGPTTFVIADLHFGDERTCRGRPFQYPHEMETRTVRRWNETVQPDDVVYVLGDIGRRSRYEKIGQLNGVKHLVAGNSDDINAIAIAGLFATISVARWLPGFLLTHLPVHPSQLRGKSINVHGHLHSARIDDPRYSCVSVEQTDYSPVPLHSLLIP